MINKRRYFTITYLTNLGLIELQSTDQDGGYEHELKLSVYRPNRANTDSVMHLKKMPNGAIVPALGDTECDQIKGSYYVPNGTKEKVFLTPELIWEYANSCYK